MSGTKPTFRVPAGSDKQKAFVNDSFQNFGAALGYGTNNISSGSTYGFNPVSRNHTILEWSYRGSWIVKQVIDAVADDMTREGIVIESDIPPDEIDKIYQYLNQKLFWQRLNSTIKWARLYGGCLAVILIKGQKPETPLRPETITKDQFLGLKVLDRWMVWPHLEDPVDDFADPDYGYPKYYEVVADAKTVPAMKIHHTRCLRLDGVELPYWQKISENMWGLSVLEPLWDRLIAFDSTTQGAAQLVYRAHLRTLKLEKLRELIAFGGEGYQAVLKQIQMIRLMQSNEGLTVLDSTDEFECHDYSFAGLSDVLIQFSQQLSGAAQIPLTRLFGQSPAGLNSTGESDLRNYYDAIAAQQEARLRPFIDKCLDITYRSMTGKELPDGFSFSFTSLWQLDAEQKANVSSSITDSMVKSVEAMIITPAIALKELRQMSKETGIYTNITDEDIKDAEDAPPPVMGMGMGPGGPQAGFGQGQQGNQPFGQKPGQQPPKGQQKGPGQEKPKDPKEPDPPKAEHRVKTTEKVTKFQKDELPMEDVVLGSDDESNAVWVVEQRDSQTGEFLNYKYCLQFSDRDEALEAFRQNNTGQIGMVTRTNIDGFKQFISDVKPMYMNGAS